MTNHTIIPLYSYIPYLDPGDFDTLNKRSFSSNTKYSDDELDQLHTENEIPKLPKKTTVDSFKQQVDENLKNLSNKMTDLLQDGLGGVDDLCKRVKDVISQNKQVYTEDYDKADIHEYREETRYSSPATDTPQEAIHFKNRVQEETIREFHNNDNTVFTMQTRAVAKDANLPNKRPRLNSKSHNSERSTSRLKSKSFEASVELFLNKKNSEEIKSSKTKPNKRTVEAVQKPIDESSAKRRLGQIERDYQKVVETLGMVEKMMACVNERIRHTKSKNDQTPMETVGGNYIHKENDHLSRLTTSKSHNSTERNVELTHSRKISLTTTGLELNDYDNKLESATENISQEKDVEETRRSGTHKDKQKEKKRIGTKEVVRQKRKETKEFKLSGDVSNEESLMESEENRIAEEILHQMISIEKINNPTLTNGGKLEESKNKVQQHSALNHSNIKPNESDIDAMIEKAVMVLGDLVPTDFDSSHSSSDASFKLTTKEGSQTSYEESHLIFSSSTSSGSKKTLLGEHYQKFEISQSFQDLKEFYLQEVRMKAIDRKKEEMETFKKLNETDNITTEQLKDGNTQISENKIFLQLETQEIKEIKKMEILSESSSYSSLLSIEDSNFWANKDQYNEVTIHVESMKQVSILCKKLISDLVVKEETISLEKIMDGYFNVPLIQSLVGRARWLRSVKINTPIQDPDLRSIVPEVRRKKALPDLHERMEEQIRQTDSFHGFLNLMDKKNREAMIKQAESQDHTVRFKMKTCFRKRYPFRVVTASVPEKYDHKFRHKKEPEKKYINSLWFSPKDFKLRRNSRIFNRKRMEMYCQSLNESPIIQKSKYGESVPRERQKIEHASNYSSLVRSGTPLGHRPNTPCRGIQLRPSTSADGTPHRLHHCDILDDLTLKDLAPFNAEYPRNDDRHQSQSFEEGLLYTLACGEQKAAANRTLMDLITPKPSCTQRDCTACTCKSELDKRPARKIRSPRKSEDESSVTSTKTELRNVTTKAAAQLLIRNIDEIRSRKSSTKSMASERNLHKNKEKKSSWSVKNSRNSSKKVLTQESKAVIRQKLEENVFKKIFQNHHLTVSDPKSTPTQKMKPFKGIERFQKTLGVPGLYSRPTTRRSNVSKLFPYINNPDNKVFQNITVLPVEVFYNLETPKDSSGKGVPQPPSPRVVQPISITSLSETDELEVCRIQYRRPSTAEDKNLKAKTIARGRLGISGIPSPTLGLRHSTNLPPDRTGPPPPMGCPIDITNSRKSKEIIGANQETFNFSRTSPRSGRSNHGKSTESDHLVNRPTVKRPGNPNPWKPTSRRPRTPKTPPPPKAPTRIRSTEKSNFKQLQSCKTISTGRISPVYNSRLQHKTYQKSLFNSPTTEQDAKNQPQMQTIINKERKITFKVNPSKNFHDIDLSDAKSNTTRASIHKHRPLSPTQRVMVEHLQALSNRNTRLRGNIQQAINIIEEKMVDVLSTKDQRYKKKTIDRMEKEINKVLRMINDQNCIMNKRKEKDNLETRRQDAQENIFKTDHIKCYSESSKQTSDDDSQKNTKAPVTPTLDLKMPKSLRKRSISRISKFNCRPSTVEEEKNFDITEGDEVLMIKEGTASHEEAVLKTKDEANVVEEKVQEATSKHDELYPSSIVKDEGETQLCPVLRCPTPKPSVTKLSPKTKNILKKMSRETFGKFADVVRTKTRLIINMTETIEVDDANLLPNPRITSALPAILAISTSLPVITTPHQPRPYDLLSTDVSSMVTVHQTPIEGFLNARAEASSATKEISRFADVCAENSLTNFGESESYLLGNIEKSRTLELERSTYSLKRKISIDQTPFTRALDHLKPGRLFEKRHHLLPVEESPPDIRKMMSFLEELSKVKERFERTKLSDVQLMWNPERRCSFHNSITGTKKFRFGKYTKSISEHFIVESPATSISELFTTLKIEEISSEPMENTEKDPQKQTDTEKPNQNPIMGKSYEAKKEVMDSNSLELNLKHEQKREFKLVISEVQLMSISDRKNPIKKHKKRPPISSHYKEPILMLRDDRFCNFLKCFYLIFYTLMYFIMTTMNFSC